MSFVNYAPVNAGGRIEATSDVVSPSSYLGGFRYRASDSALVVAVGGVPTVFTNGYGFTATGALCIDTAASAIAGYVSGLPINAAGALLANTAAAVASYQGGWPVVSDGRLAVTVVA